MRLTLRLGTLAGLVLVLIQPLGAQTREGVMGYFLPSAMGIAPPASTGIDARDYKSAEAFEKRTLTRDQIIAELEKSFAFVPASMAGMPDAKLNSPLEVFGEKSTNRGLWLSTTTHLHEHMGRLIAYARSNTVTPPWSK